MTERPSPPARLPAQYRVATVTRDAIDAERRTVDLSFASTAPVDRWFGREVLSMSADAMRMDRIASGRAPLLLQHDPDQQIGVVETARLDGEVARATVRFGNSTLAKEVFADVADGIRSNVSVGYWVDKMVLREVESGAGGDAETYDVVDWTPFEISIVSTPADPSVGVGRSAEGGETRPVTVIRAAPAPTAHQPTELDPTPTPPAPPEPKERSMTAIDTIGGAPAVDPAVALAAAREQETTRVREIAAAGAKYNMRDKADQAIATGMPLEAWRGLVIDHFGSGAASVMLRDLDVGMSAAEAKRYSVKKAIQALCFEATKDSAYAVDAGFEREISNELAKRGNKPAKGLYVPLTFSMDGAEERASEYARDLVAGTATAGGNLVQTYVLGPNFIDILRSKLGVAQMGSTMLPGLQGNIALPRQSGAATTYWVAENAAPAVSQQTFDQVTLSPKTLGAYTQIGRQLLLQSEVAVQEIVRQDLLAVLALGIDLAALLGTGAANQPKGISNTSGVGAVVGGTNGAQPTWNNIVQLEGVVAGANADIDTLGYLASPKCRSFLKQQTKVSAYPQYCWDDTRDNKGRGVMNGYPAGVTNQIPNNGTKGTSAGVTTSIYFGAWSQLVIGMWGALDFIVNPYSLDTQGALRLTALQSVDVGLRHPEAFAVMSDALPQ